MITINQNKIRTGTIKTPHGEISFPAFLPDATYGTIQNLSFADLAQTGISEIVTTTLHIQQKLTGNYLEIYGGFHKLTGWDRPILTDSGGFQVFSLISRNKSKHNKITDAGCSFIDYRDGSYNFISPETSQIIQHQIGSDIRVVLDEPLIESANLSDIKQSVKRTTEWARRSKQQYLLLNNLSEADFNNPKIKRPLLCAVVQGANNMEYRKQSANDLVAIGFDIYGLGGMPLKVKKQWNYEDEGGFHKELLHNLASWLPKDKIRYALGVGTPDDLKFCIENGWDIFDTVLPTRNARHGYLYVHSGEGDTQYETYDVLHIKNKKNEFADEPIDKQCGCHTCKTTSRAYLRYLIKNKEGAGMRLATIHNLAFYSEILESFRS